MTQRPLYAHQTGFRLLVTLTLIGLVAACASGGPHGRKPPAGPGPDGPSGDRPDTTRMSGEIARPVSLLFTGMDENRDYEVSREELQNGIQAAWLIVPKNANEMITPVGFELWSARAFGNKATLPSRISFDTDLNGSITQEEFETRLTIEFNELDKNQDGVVTRSEMISSLPSARMGQPMQGNRPSGGGRGGNGDRPPPR